MTENTALGDKIFIEQMASILQVGETIKQISYTLKIPVCRPSLTKGVSLNTSSAKMLNFPFERLLEDLLDRSSKLDTLRLRWPTTLDDLENRN